MYGFCLPFFNLQIYILLPKRADLGISDLSITHERRQAVDFTKPFMNLGTTKYL